MSSLLNSIFFFIIALGILISIHEYGHFWVARRCGVKVLRFSIGFGRPLWRRIGADGVEYVLALFPLGGYVKMLDEAEGEVLPEERSQAFNCQSVEKRFLIALAGPLANFLLAIVLYVLVFTMGVEGIRPIIGKVASGSLSEKSGLQAMDEIVAVDDKAVNNWQMAMFALLDGAMNNAAIAVSVLDEEGRNKIHQIDFSRGFLIDDDSEIDVLKQMGVTPYSPKLEARLGIVQSGKAASQAGLQQGDTIINVDGEPVNDWSHWVELIRNNPGKRLELDVVREQTHHTLFLIPERVTKMGEHFGFVGVAPDLKEAREIMQDLRVMVSYSFPDSLWKSIEKTWDMSLLTLRVLGKIITGEASVSNLSGPISIAQYAGDTASAGPVTFLMFLAVISISLGVLNLLPIPMLDGGHLLYYLVEFFIGKPVPSWVQEAGARVGIFILICLMSIAFYNDILRLMGEG